MKEKKLFYHHPAQNSSEKKGYEHRFGLKKKCGGGEEKIEKERKNGLIALGKAKVQKAFKVCVVLLACHTFTPVRAGSDLFLSVVKCAS